MFKKLMIIPLVLGTVMVSCKKDDDGDGDGDGDGSTTTCQVTEYKKTTQFSAKTNGEYVETDTYFYNEDGTISEVRQTYDETFKTTEWYDKKVVNYTDGKVTSIDYIYVYIEDTTALKTAEETPFGSMTLTYDGDTLVSAMEIEWEDTATYSFSYKDGLLESMTATSSNSDDTPVSFRNITWTDGNVTRLEADFSGSGDLWVWLTVDELDSHDNYYQNLLFDPEEVVFSWSKNNALSVVNDNDVVVPAFDDNGTLVGIETIPAGTKIIDHTLTYDEHNNVVMVTVNETPVQEEGYVADLTWSCQ